MQHPNLDIRWVFFICVMTCAGATELAILRPPGSSASEAGAETALETIAEETSVSSFAQLQAATGEPVHEDVDPHSSSLPCSTISSSHGSFELKDEASIPRGDSAQSLHSSWQKFRERGFRKGSTPSPASSEDLADDTNDNLQAQMQMNDLEPASGHEDSESSALLIRDDHGRSSSARAGTRQQSQNRHDKVEGSSGTHDEENGHWQEGAGKSADEQPWYRDREVSFHCACRALNRMSALSEW